MCEMIDEIEIEYLKMAIARTKKEQNSITEEEKPLVVATIQ